jgi:hypothetical protein
MFDFPVPIVPLELRVSALLTPGPGLIGMDDATKDIRLRQQT